MKPDQIVFCKPCRQLPPFGNGLEGLRVGKRNVQKEADPASNPERPEFMRQRDHLVVMDPDHIVQAHRLGDHSGHSPGHFAIGHCIMGFDVDKIHTAMQSRPEHRVGVPQIIVPVEFGLEFEQPDFEIGALMKHQ